MTPIFLDLPKLAEVLTLSESTVQKLTREAMDFPKPRLLSGRRVAWLLREVMDWAETRPTSELLPPPNTSKPKRSMNLQNTGSTGEQSIRSIQ
jgi:prophage regulatory protein